MTGVCGAAYPGTEWERVLVFSDHPAAARHPSNGGELGMVLYFLLCSINVSHSRAGIIDWIATLCHYDKTHIISLYPYVRGDGHVRIYFEFQTCSPAYTAVLWTVMHVLIILANCANLPHPPAWRWQMYDAMRGA